MALIDWSQLLEDFLDNIGVTFEAFCEEMSGGWMFGYVEALKRARVRTVLFCVSARVRRPSGFRHRATGATIKVLPAPRAYLALRRRVVNPYATTLVEAVSDLSRASAPEHAWWAACKELAPYLSTPPLHLMRELHRERCDVILCQDYEHGRFDLCLLLGRALGLPVYAAFQGGDRPTSRWLEPLARRHALRWCDGLIVAPRSEAKRLRSRYRLKSTKMARIFNPLDVAKWAAADEGGQEREAARRELAIPEKARVCVWHGRVDFHRKGLDVLLSAWRRVCLERPLRELRLLLIGTGNNAGLLRAAVAQQRPQGLIWIDRYIRDGALIRRYLLAADVYAFPSRHEGFPVAPVEAMACGLPLVAADAPGVPDILEEGEASGGLMVARGDVGAFAAALGRVLDDEALSAAMGAHARARVARVFSLEAVGAELRSFLLSN